MAPHQAPVPVRCREKSGSEWAIREKGGRRRHFRWVLAAAPSKRTALRLVLEADVVGVVREHQACREASEQSAWVQELKATAPAAQPYGQSTRCATRAVGVVDPAVCGRQVERRAVNIANQLLGWRARQLSEAEAARAPQQRVRLRAARRVEARGLAQAALAAQVSDDFRASVAEALEAAAAGSRCRAAGLSVGGHGVEGDGDSETKWTTGGLAGTDRLVGTGMGGLARAARHRRSVEREDDADMTQPLLLPARAPPAARAALADADDERSPIWPASPSPSPPHRI